MWYSFILFPGGWARAFASLEETKPFPNVANPERLCLRGSVALEMWLRNYLRHIVALRPDTDVWRDVIKFAILFLWDFLLFVRWIGLCFYLYRKI